MLPIAGQTAGPIGLIFFVDTQEWPGSVIGYINRNFFEIFLNIFFSKAALVVYISYITYNLFVLKLVSCCFLTTEINEPS